MEIPALLGEAEDGDEILGSHAKNCDRDSTRFPKSVFPDDPFTYSVILVPRESGFMDFVGNIGTQGKRDLPIGE